MAVIGVPVRTGGKLYNCAAVIQNGAVLGVVPKTVLPNYGEFYEKRQFSSGADYRGENTIRLAGWDVPFGRDLLFCCREMPDFVLGVEICEDLWAPVTPSTGLCLAGATVIANLSASNELIGKTITDGCWCRPHRRGSSAVMYMRTRGMGESTRDMGLLRAQPYIRKRTASCGEEALAKNGLIATEIDPSGCALSGTGTRALTRAARPNAGACASSQELRDTELTRHIARRPFGLPTGRYSPSAPRQY